MGDLTRDGSACVVVVFADSAAGLKDALVVTLVVVEEPTWGLTVDDTVMPSAVGDPTATLDVWVMRGVAF